jgi:hypothetical protein
MFQNLFEILYVKSLSPGTYLSKKYESISQFQMISIFSTLFKIDPLKVNSPELVIQ